MICDHLLVPSEKIIKGLPHNFRLADFRYFADFLSLVLLILSDLIGHCNIGHVLNLLNFRYNT